MFYVSMHFCDFIVVFFLLFFVYIVCSLSVSLPGLANKDVHFVSGRQRRHSLFNHVYQILYVVVLCIFVSPVPGRVDVDLLVVVVVVDVVVTVVVCGRAVETTK